MDNISDYYIELVRKSHKCGKYLYPLENILGATEETTCDRYLCSSDLGVVSGSLVDDTLSDAMAKAVEEGKILRVVEGEYVVGNSASITLGEGEHLHMILERGAVIKATAGSNSPLLAVDGDTSRTSSFTLEGPGGFDAKGAGAVTGAQGSTALQLRFLDEATVLGVEFIFGDGYKDNFGDSGITCNSAGNLTIERCYFRGCPDSGVYVTGSSLLDDTSDDGQSFHIENNRFIRCKNDVSTKRQFTSGVFTSNYSEESYFGFTALGSASGSTLLPSGTNNIISNNVFNKTTRPIDVRTNFNNIIQGNIIKGWGYDYNAPVQTQSRGIKVQGCSGTVVTGNVLDATGTNPSYAIDISDGSYGGVTYPGGSCLVDNTHVGSSTIPYADANASTSSDVRVLGSGLPYSTAAVRPDTFVEITDTLSSTKKLYKGPTVLVSY